MKNERLVVACTIAAAFVVTAVGIGQGQARRFDGVERSIEPVSANTGACKAAVLQASIPSNTTVTTATVLPATVQTPQHCLVHATIATVGNRVGIAVALPTAWNRTFVFTPAAGFGGTLSLGSSVLGRGYAVATTDTGHTAVDANNGVRDATWALNAPAKMTDFGYRSMNVSTEATKAITVAYYGHSISRSVFSGCSGAGRLAMISAQRYPNDYDGYVVKAPALDWVDLGVSQNHRAKAMFDTPDSWIPPAKYFVLGRAVLDACDGLDGVVDGIVEDPRRCSFNPRSIQCTGGDGSDCLTGAQVEVVEKVVRGAVNSFGETVSPGLLLTGAEASSTSSQGWDNWLSGSTAPPVDANGKPQPAIDQSLSMVYSLGVLGYQLFQDPAWDWRSFDLDTQFGLTAALAGETNALDTQIMPAAARGAKFILSHGWTDAALNPLHTVRYYEAVVARYGQETTDGFIRLFMVPGMHHCSGGDNATDRYDALGPMERWLETGVAPDQIQASHVENGVVTRTRPLCAYPMVATYRASADATNSINDASNFFCTAPAS